MCVDLKNFLEFVEPGHANFITHVGKFHADEVGTTAILLMIRQKLADGDIDNVSHPAFEYLRNGGVLKLARVDNQTLAKLNPSEDVLVYDIGGGEFDHHQTGRNGIRENGIYYSSVGLIWRKFGKLLCSNDRVWQMMDDEVISVIDAGDNGQFPEVSNSVPIFGLSDIVEDFNPNWNQSQDKSYQNQRFEQVVSFMYGVLVRALRNYEAIELARGEVVEAIKDSQDGIMILKTYMPWKKVLFDCGLEKANEIRLIVYPSNRGGFYLEAVRDADGANRILMPEEWRGRDFDLSNEIEGATFCHASGFIAGADTLEHAINMAKTIIRKRA